MLGVWVAAAGDMVVVIDLIEEFAALMSARQIQHIIYSR
jgi:hypothetical protein